MDTVLLFGLKNVSQVLGKHRKRNDIFFSLEFDFSINLDLTLKFAVLVLFRVARRLYFLKILKMVNISNFNLNSR